MSVPDEQLKRAKLIADKLASMGYFARVKAGDQVAASLFARLVAFTLNPTGSSADFGALTKPAGGANVDGYAEDAICYGSDPNNLENVVDLVGGAGAPGARIIADQKPRRATDLWEQPKQLSDAQRAYLLDGGTETEPAPPAPKLISREQFYFDLGQIDGFYKSSAGLQRPGGMVKFDAEGRTIADVEALGAWGYDLMLGTPLQECIKRIRQSLEWQQKHPNERP